MAAPIRKLSRLGNEMHLSGSRAVLDLTEGRHDLGVVALLLMSRCAADWTAGGAIDVPHTLTQTMSIRAIANSLHAPYASIHRHLTALRACGLVVDAGGGFAISAAPEPAAAVVEFLRTAHDCLIRLIEDLAPDVDLPAARDTVAPTLCAAIVATALDIWLIPFEAAREPVTDWTAKLVWIVIAVANVRHITCDPLLSARYAVWPTPDDVRRPITARRIAALTGLSYGTTYRQCQALSGHDVIAYDRGGWLVASHQLADRSVDRGVKGMIAYYVKRIGELAALGLDAERVRAFYLHGRPDYVPLTTD